MSWTAPMTWVTGAVVTAANLNTHLRDNLLQTSPALAATKGDQFAVSAANTLLKVAVGADGLVWTADAASTGGIKWAAVASSSNARLRFFGGDF